MKVSPAWRLLEKAAVAFLLFSAASVTVFARSTMTWEDFLMPAVLLATGIMITVMYRLAYSIKFFFLILAYLALCAVQTLIFGTLHAKHLFLYPLNLWVAYCFVKAMRERFLDHLETLIATFSGISLICWIIDTVSNGTLRSALKGVTLGTPYNPIISSYVLVQTFIDENVTSAYPRNSGFAWEPGAFAVICCLGLAINLLKNKFRLLGNGRGIVMLFALLSSLSTTGYSILGMFLLFKLWHDMSKVGRMFVFPVLAAALIVGMSTLPFMQNKVEKLQAQDLMELQYSASREWNISNPIAAQRFLSLKIDFSDFLNNPLTGYGGEEDQMLVRRESFNIVSVSGIGKILARFGIFGFLFFAWSTISSSIALSRMYNAKSPALVIAFIFAVSFSYSLIEHPLFLSLWCFKLFDGIPRTRGKSVTGVAK